MVRHYQGPAPAKAFGVSSWSLIVIGEIRSAIFSAIGGRPTIVVTQTCRPPVPTVRGRGFLRGGASGQQCERPGSCGSAHDAAEK